MIPFVKMHGAGNDFVCLDFVTTPSPCRDERAREGEGAGGEGARGPENYAGLAQTLCDRNFGVGSDGILVIERGDLAPFRMRMFNPDGSEAEMCGNGTRCVGRFLVEREYAPLGPLDLEVFGRVVVLDIGEDQVSVDMGFARIVERDRDLAFHGYMGTVVDMGNPHVVIFVEDISTIPLEKHGRAIETSPLFPGGTNVHFVRRVSESEVVVLHWERGAGATLACGSGACAVAVAVLDGPGRVTVNVPGGVLSLEIDDRGHANKTGPARTVFDGEWPE